MVSRARIRTGRRRSPAIGAPQTRDAQGRAVSPWGFDYHVTGDLVARPRRALLPLRRGRCGGGYAAIVAKIESAFGDRAAREALALRTAMSRATGIPVDAVDGWARGAEVRAAAAEVETYRRKTGRSRGCDPR